MSLDEVVAFVEIVERGGFTAAAEGLGVSASVLSKRMLALEERLSTQLLQRTTRKVVLTEAGRLFYERLRDVPRIVAESEEAIRELAETPQGRLRVAMPTYFASSGFHLQVIPDYLAASPHVHLDVDIVGDPIAALRGDYDLVVAGVPPGRRLPDTSLVGRRILRFRGALFAAPSYLEAHGTPSHPRELERHNCVSYPDREWRFAEEDGTPIVVHARGTLTANSNAMLYAAVLRGLGIAFTFPIFYDTEEAEGRVVRVLDDFVARAPVDIHVFYPAARFVPRRTRLFIDALAEHFAAQGAS
jgi:DNA-binding transcriptional LysR family regulator